MTNNTFNHSPRYLVQQFAKLPRWGQVKTRFQRGTNAAKAMYLHTLLLEHVYQTMRLGPTFNYELWLDQPADGLFELASGALFEGVPKTQLGSDLGKRMQYAINTGLKSAERVCLIGSDCPLLTLDHINQSFEALDDADACLIPAEDGGFVLIACKITRSDMFKGVHWGSETVLKETLKSFKNNNINVVLLEPLIDIDSVADLDGLLSNNVKCEYLPESLLKELSAIRR